MCGGVEVAGRYSATGKPIRVYFPTPKAALPVLQAGGRAEWITWGRRKEQPGHLPATGWARDDSITAGKWACYQPQTVDVMAERFMEKDEAKQSHWFDLTEGQTIEALLLELGEERRVYLVTTAAPHNLQTHDRWPSLMPVTPHQG